MADSSLGTLSVYLKADISHIKNNLSEAIKEVNKFASSLEKIQKTTKKSFKIDIKLPKNISKNLSDAVKPACQLADCLERAQKAALSLKNLGLNIGKSLVKGTKDLGKNIQTGLEKGVGPKPPIPKGWDNEYQAWATKTAEETRAKMGIPKVALGTDEKYRAKESIPKGYMGALKDYKAGQIIPTNLGKDIQSEMNKVMQPILAKGPDTLYKTMDGKVTDVLTRNMDVAKQYSAQIQQTFDGAKTSIGRFGQYFQTKLTGITDGYVQAKNELGKPIAFVGPKPQVMAEYDAWKNKMMKLGYSSSQLTNKQQDLASGMLKVTPQIKGSTEQIGKSFQTMSKQGISGMFSLQSMLQKITHYITFSIGVQMVMAVRRGFEQLIENFKEFERAATNAATISGYLGGAFEDVRDKIMEVSKELGRNTVFSALDVSKAYYNLASAGYDVASMTSKDLLPLLNYAAATQSTLEESTYSVSTALKAFNMDFEEATRVVDTFTAAITNSFMTFQKMREAMKYVGPIAGALGLELEETVSALVALVDRGMEGSQAGQRLNMIFTKLLKPTEKTEKMLAGLGLTMDDLNPEVYTLTEILYKLKAAGFGAAEAATMFRARTAASATVLVEAVDSIDRYNQMLITSKGITESVAQEQQNTLWGSFQLMNNALQEAGLRIGETLAPALASLADTIANRIAPYVADLVKTFIKFLPVIMNIVKAFIVYKSIMFVLTKAYAIAIAVTKAWVFIQSLANKGIRGGTIALIQHILVKKGLTLATITATGAVKAFAIAMALATAGISIIVGLLSTTAFGFMDTAVASNEATTSLGKFAEAIDIPIDKLVADIGEINAVVYESSRSMDHLSDIMNEFGMDIPLDMKIADFGDSILKGISDIPLVGTIFDNLWVGKQLSSLSDSLQSQMRQRMIDLIGITQEENDVLIESGNLIKRVSSELVGYNNSIIEVKNALKEEIESEENLEKIREKMTDSEKSNIQELIDAEDRYVKAKENRRKVEANLLGSTRTLLTEIRSHSTAMDKGIGYLEDWSEATIKLESKNEDLRESLINESKAARDLANAIAEFGTNSEEAIDAEIDLRKESEDRASLQTEISELEDEANKAIEKRNHLIEHGIEVEGTYAKLRSMGISEETIRAEFRATEAFDKFKDSEDDTIKMNKALTETEEALYDISQRLVEARNAETKALTSEAILKAKIQALDTVREDLVKLTNEKLKLYLETQSKIYNIEEKLYKLREGEKDQFDELFQKLAEEGLVNKETIELYKEMMKSEGGVLKLNNSLMGVFGELSDTQRDYAENLINTTEGTDEYYKALGVLEGAGLTQEQIDIIVAYNRAEDELTDSVKNFGDTIGPVMDDLIDAGVVSPEVASAWGDIADNALEVAKANIDLALAETKVNDTMTGLIGNTSRLAKALMDEPGEDFVDILDELIEKMDLTGEIAGSDAEQLDILNKFYGKTYSTIDEFNEEQIITALTMIKVAQASKLWEDGMSGANLATEMHIGSLQAMQNEAEATWESEESMIELSRQLTEATNEVSGAVNELTKILREFTRIALGENVLEIALEFDFAENFEQNYEDFMDMFKNIGEESADLTTEIMKGWDKLDWEKWTEKAPETDFGKQLIEDLNRVAPGFDFSKIYGGKTKKEFEDEIGEFAKVINELLQDYEATAIIRTKWDDIGIESFINTKLIPNLDKVKSYITQTQPEIEINDKWGTYDDIDSWMNSLVASELVDFQNYLESNGVSVPTGMKDEFSLAIISAKNKLQTDLDANKLVIPVGYKEDLTELIKIDWDKVISEMTPVDLEKLLLGEMDLSRFKLPEQFNEEMMLRFKIQSGNVTAEDIETFVSKFSEITQSGLEQQLGAINSNFIIKTIDGETESESIRGYIKLLNSVKDKSIEIKTVDNGMENIKNNYYDPIKSKTITIKAIWQTAKAVAGFSIPGLQKGLTKTKGPQFSLIGEAGPEAVVPLAGANKKYGKEILKSIIPKYFPDLSIPFQYSINEGIPGLQTGGIIGDTVRNINQRLIGYEEPMIDDKDMIIRQSISDAKVPEIESQISKISQILEPMELQIDIPSLVQSIKQNIIYGSIKSVEDLVQTIVPNLIDLENNPIENQTQLIRQELKPVKIPPIDKYIEQIINQVPEYQYGAIIEKVSKSNIEEPDEKIQLIKQELFDTPLPIIDSVNRKINTILSESNIPIPDYLESTIKRKIIDKEISSPSDLTQFVGANIENIDVPDLEDKKVNIFQQLQDIEVPNIEGEIQYIMNSIPQYQYGTIIQKVSSANIKDPEEKEQMIKQELINTPLPMINSVYRDIKDIYNAEDMNVPDDLEQIVKQRIIDGAISTPDDLIQYIRTQLDTLEVPDIEDKKMNISQKLESVDIPDIRREVQYIMNSIPNYEYGTIIEKLSKSGIVDPEDQIQFIRQQMIDTSIPQIDAVNREVNTILSQSDIPIPPYLESIVKQSIINKEISTPNDLTQLLKTQLVDVDIPDVSDQESNIIQKVKEIDIPDIDREIKYIVDSIPRYQYGAIIEKISSSDIQKPEDKIQLIKQDMINAPIPLIESVNRKIKNIFSNEEIPIPSDLESIINQKIISEEIVSPEQLTQYIESRLINLDIPNIDDKRINISQKLEDIDIPDISREIKYIMNSVPNYQYGSIIEKVSKANLEIPEERVSLIRQELSKTTLPKIKPIISNIKSLFSDINIPEIPNLEQVINQDIIEKSISKPTDLIQYIIQNLREIDIPDLDDKEQVIEQRLGSVNIPNIDREINYILNEIPKFKRGVTETRGPVNAIIGEAGAEAVVPLEGTNRKYGKSILQKIIPKYFPDVSLMQTGGIIGESSNKDIEKAKLDESTISKDILSIIKGFSENNKSQLAKIINELTINQEDLEIDSDEFNERVKEGTLTFKAIILNIGQYLHAIISDSARVLSNSTTDMDTPLVNFINKLQSLIDTIPNKSSQFKDDILDASNGFNQSISSAYTDFSTTIITSTSLASNIIKGAATSFKSTIDKISPIEINVNIPKSARGGIMGLQKGIQETRGPQLSLIGEEGPEAVVPLSGRNKKFGEDILNYIVPKYYPDLFTDFKSRYEMSAPVGGGGGDTYEDIFNLMGPVSVYSQDPVDFMEKLKMRYRMSPGRR